MIPYEIFNKHFCLWVVGFFGLFGLFFLPQCVGGGDSGPLMVAFFPQMEVAGVVQFLYKAGISGFTAVIKDHTSFFFLPVVDH